MGVNVSMHDLPSPSVSSANLSVDVDSRPEGKLCPTAFDARVCTCLCVSAITHAMHVICMHVSAFNVAIVKFEVIYSTSFALCDLKHAYNQLALSNWRAPRR